MSFLNKKTPKAVPITPVSTANLSKWLKKQSKSVRNQVKSADFTAAAHTKILLHDANGNLSRVIFGTGTDDSIYTYSCLPAKLPENKAGYYIDATLTKQRATTAALGWQLGSYNFSRYKTVKSKTVAKLVWPAQADRQDVLISAKATELVRDLINIPPNDLGPVALATAATKMAKAHKATVKTIIGNALLKQNYPAIFEVGKASEEAPRLVDIRWGNAKHPKVTLVGKGVTFDTGGLNLKPGNSMELMKKDMGGAAHALGLAQMIMEAKLPVRLRVLVPVVENSVSDKSFRPSDIIKTRKGISVEIDNTDAEGRLILCDALAEACNEKPKLIIDFATLTGAARVALGPDLPAVFSNDKKIANDICIAGEKVEDPVWQLPLWQPYNSLLSSTVADVRNSARSGFGGAITAALFLEKFVDKNIPWVHFDTYGWCPFAKHGRPVGGEAYGIRASFELIKNKFGKNRK